MEPGEGNNMNMDIWGDYEELNEDGYYECSCGWFGEEAYKINDFGVEIYLCPNCAQELS